MVQTVTRNASLGDLAALLQQQHARKIDVVAPAGALRLEEGSLTLKGVEPILHDDGVTDANGIYVPTAVFDEGLADKFGVPLAYVRRLRAERPDLLDANVNGWLHGRKAKWVAGRPSTDPIREAIPGDRRSFLVRLFRDDDGGNGIARALLSDRYQVVDNLDVLMSALDGVREAGVDAQVKGADLTERRMVVRVAAPSVQMLAPTLLAGYRSPFSGASGDENPTVFAGFRLSNSETGGGAFTIVPEITVQVCDNGMTITKDAIRTVHLGGRLEEGVIRWSEETQEKNLALVKAKTADAVRTFLDVDYMRGVIDSMTEAATQPIEKPADEIKVIAKRLAFSQEQADGILDHFIRGGQMNRMGVVNAITSFSQTLGDPDAAHDLDMQAMRALEVASR